LLFIREIFVTAKSSEHKNVSRKTTIEILEDDPNRMTISSLNTQQQLRS